jgi:putative ABC transport system substrate-binding protein
LRRRQLLAAASAIALLPHLARGQDSGRVYRVGLLVFDGSSPASRDAAFAVFIEELAKAGFVEGKNLAIERLGIATRPDQFPELARKVGALGVDALYAAGAPAAEAAKRATSTLPIAAIVDDMVGSGIVTSLAQPGGNLTGISILATELDGKRQEILFELLPQIRRMAALADPKVGPPAHLQGPSPSRDSARRRAAGVPGRQHRGHLRGDRGVAGGRRRCGQRAGLAAA